ncbi:hypothetical protein [Chlamydia vaughanii]|uniref:hypothetical protein n=1 Tax=Chlamydia vaughanii TaxID=3112552 RepID=UPI0032B22E3C
MRKRNSFFHPTSNQNKEPLTSLLQKTISVVEKFAKHTTTSENIDISSVCDNIQEIRTILDSHSQDIDNLSNKNSEDKIVSLERDMNLMKISIQDLLDELKDLKILLEEGIDSSVNDHNYLVQSILLEIYQKFLSAYGGVMYGDINMNAHAICGLETPEIAKDSHAVSVGYLGAQLRPILDDLTETHTKVKKHDADITSVQFQMMPVSGGKFHGAVDMNGNRLAGVGDPKERSDAISLEYLEKYLASKNSYEPTLEPLSPLSPPSMEGNLLYSTGLNYLLENSLPIDLLSEGLIGFTWGAKSSSCSGIFPISSLKYTQMNEDCQCFMIQDDILYGKYPGIYTWDLTLKALLPSILDYKNPSVKLRVYYEQANWNRKKQLQEKTSYQRIPLTQTGTMVLRGQSYDIVELTPGDAKTFIVNSNCSGISIQVENDEKTEWSLQDLYIMQAELSCSWRKY